MRTPIVVSILVLVGIAFYSPPARACDVAGFQTPYDLFDAADLVAIVDVVTAPGVGRRAASVTVVETLKGAVLATMDVFPMGGSCTPPIAAGVRGVVFLDQKQHVIGAFAGFVQEAAVADALRAYAAATTNTERAAPIAAVAVSKDWTASFQAAYVLADRVELLRALDPASREAIIKRLRSVGGQHTLVRVAARLADPRVKAIARRRSFDDEAMLAAVIAGKFEAVKSVDELADVIEAPATSARDRIAALERCERVWSRMLAQLNTYAYDAAKLPVWRTRAATCRSGTKL